MRARFISIGAVAIYAAACGGDPQPPPFVPYDGGVIVQPDTGVDAGVRPDVGPRPDLGVVAPNENVTLSGSVIDLQAYLAGRSESIGGVQLRPLGVQNIQPVTSQPATGNYSLQVPQNGKIVIQASRLASRSTYAEITVADQPIANKNFYLASDTYATALGNQYGVNVLVAQACHPPNPPNLQCRMAIIMGRVVDDGSYDNGTPTPVAGIAAADFTIKGENDVNWYKDGPHFLRPDGTPAGGLTTTQRERDPITNKYRGGLYVVFVEVPITGNPPKQFEITISSRAGGNVVRQFGPTIFKGFNGGLSWVTIPETGQTPPQPPPPPNEVNFETQIYPLFLPVNQGGLGCHGCHTNQNGAVPAGGMNLYGGPAVAYASLNPANYPQRVNLANPAQSYLLRRPLYEEVQQDHPIFAFLSDQDPSYQLIYNWIRLGAVYNGQVVDPPVSFYNDVRPLLYRPDGQGGIGCYNCHVNGVDANTAPGGFYMGGNGNELYNELTQEAPTNRGPNLEQYRINKNPGQAGNSLILLNPLIGSPVLHPAKLLQGTQDPRYQTIYRWINQGYQNDTPP